MYGAMAGGGAVPVLLCCRHSFASVLLHEGRSVTYVARQLGQSAALTMRTYGHVIGEPDDAPRITAEDAISITRRGNDVRPKCVA
jgi:integrase